MECFTIYADEIEDRLDADYYKLRNLGLIKSKYNKIKIKDLFIIRDGDHSILPIKYISSSSEGVRYLRAQDLKNGEIISENPIYISKEYFLSIPRSHIKPGYFLFSIMATIGSVAVAPEELKECTANRAVGILIPKDENIISPNFLKSFFSTKIGISLLNKIKKGGLQQRINLKDIGEMEIPLPPLEIQNKIVSLTEKAYYLRKSKESESQQLLDSINNYILGELGIKLPESKERLTYSVFSEETKSERLDPRYYKPFFKEFEDQLNRRKDIKSLGEIAEYIGSGATPRAGGNDYTSKEDGVPFIRIVNLKNNTIILNDNTLNIKKSIHEGMLKRTQLKPNDVLLSMAGTIGLSVVVPETIKEANINQAIARIVLKQGVEPLYVSTILNSKIGRIQTDRLSRPSVQANINLEEIRTLKIPIPKPEIQNRITEEVKARMQKAEQLQREAKDELEKAKKEAEKIILGDN